MDPTKTGKNPSKTGMNPSKTNKIPSKTVTFALPSPLASVFNLSDRIEEEAY
jgi:hypothetical protein